MVNGLYFFNRMINYHIIDNTYSTYVIPLASIDERRPRNSVCVCRPAWVDNISSNIHGSSSLADVVMIPSMRSCLLHVVSRREIRWLFCFCFFFVIELTCWKENNSKFINQKWWPKLKWKSSDLTCKKFSIENNFQNKMLFHFFDAFAILFFTFSV